MTRLKGKDAYNVGCLMSLPVSCDLYWALEKVCLNSLSDTTIGSLRRSQQHETSVVRVKCNSLTTQ